MHLPLGFPRGFYNQILFNKIYKTILTNFIIIISLISGNFKSFRIN